MCCCHMSSLALLDLASQDLFLSPGVVLLWNLMLDNVDFLLDDHNELRNITLKC